MTQANPDRLRWHIDRIEEMFASSADWEIKFHRIFGYGAENVQPLIEAFGLRLEYCDPDTTYQEDVTAYVQALRDLRKRMGDIT